MLPPIDRPTQLIYHKNQPDERVIVRFKEGLGGNAEFGKDNKYLANYMAEIGVTIPQGPRFHEIFGDKEVVTSEDKLFGQAFFVIYFPQSKMAKDCTWEDMDTSKG